MTQSVTEFLAALPPERAAELQRVRAAIRRALPKGYEEAVAGKVIAYQVPLAVYPDTYNRQPLRLAALGAPKTTLTPVPRESPRPRSAVHPSRVL